MSKVFKNSGYFDICSTNRSFWPGSHHSGQANMLFADGHVESARQTNWIAAAGTMTTNRIRKRGNDRETLVERF
jgi:prepilin-type processing-associated H-X9-DG protein